MSKIDKTRDKIKVEELATSDRKVLFEKFVKAGGKVVTEKKHQPIKIDRTKQREFAQRLDEQRKKNAAFAPESTLSADKSKNILSSAAHQPSGFDTFWSRIRLYFMGVTNLGGEYFKKGFLETFRSEINPALMELQLVYLDVFKQNPNSGYLIIERLDDIRALYYELIEMTGDIWEQSLSSALIDRYSVLPDEKYRVYSHRDAILQYFRKLYILQRYVDTINFAFDKAIDLQATSEKGKPSIYAAKKKRVRNSLFIVFNKFFPRLYWLFCMMKGEIIPLYNEKRLDNLFDIKPFMKPGSRTAHQPPTERLRADSSPTNSKKETANADEEKAPEKEQVSDDVRRGLDMMKEIDIPQLKTSIDKNDPLLSIDEKDPIFQTYFILLEFDREYSCLLTTLKIKFYNLHDSRGLVNYRTKLSDIYNMMRPAYDAMNQYFIASIQNEEAQNDRPTSSDQYYKYTKRLSELESAQMALFRAAKSSVTSFTTNVAELLRALIQDMNVRHEIIQNPQDVLDFDDTIEGYRKINGKKIYEALVEAYSYSMAFCYRMSPGGDLYSADKKDDTSSQFLASLPPQQINRVKTVSTSAPKQGSSKTSSFVETETPDQNSKSILGELDAIEKIDDLP